MKEGADSVSKKLGSGGDFKKIYEGEAQTNIIASSWSSTQARISRSDDGNSITRTDNKSYNIPISGNAFLYAITFTLGAGGLSNDLGDSISSSITYTLKTIEGKTIETDSCSHSRGSGAGSGSASKNVSIDLLAKSFTTTGDYLILEFYASNTARTGHDNNGLAYCSSSFSGLTAKYIVLPE